MTHRTRLQHARTPQNRGRYPGFDVLDQATGWDRPTAGIVLARLRAAPCSFFTEPEAGIAGALLDRLLAQDSEPRIPVLSLVDARLAVGETDGWHYDDLPEDGPAWRQSVAALDQDAMQECGQHFPAVPIEGQQQLIQHVQDAAGDAATWHDLPAAHIWSLWTRYACTAFYSHPWAWNEIGFPGPAYPRGYLSLGVDARERFEVADQFAADPIPFADRVQRAHRRHSVRSS